MTSTGSEPALAECQIRTESAAEKEGHVDPASKGVDITILDPMAVVVTDRMAVETKKASVIAGQVRLYEKGE